MSNSCTTCPLGGGSKCDRWPIPVTISKSNFKYKSLSNWACNTAVGCLHGCLFCYVPETSTRKMAVPLARFGVSDPDAEWGTYAFPREWSETKFLTSLRKAEDTPPNKLKADGNRAVLFCSTTDPFQVFRHEDPELARSLRAHADQVIRRSLELIRDESTLNVRILTRSPLAKRYFPLMRSFGPRLLFGMSLPTLDNRLARIYEPDAPSPSQRLKTLREAREAGLHVFVAVAPTYPECGREDLRRTLEAVAGLDPVTVFHEPINIRAKNVERIRVHAESIGATVDTSVFDTRDSWQSYAMNALETVEELAGEVGLSDRLHLWPDKTLGSKTFTKAQPDPAAHRAWIDRWWSRISEWPSASAR